MELISIEKSQQYIPLSEDYTGLGVRDCKFFTLTLLENGWEKVTYFTSRRKNKYINYQGEYDSWIYILSNPSIPNHLKIGYTHNTPDIRASQLSKATGVAQDFIVEWSFNCHNGQKLEKEIHNALNDYRVNNNREFFNISISEAIDLITQLGIKYTNLQKETK